MTFSEDMASLEDIIKKIESENLSLEESLEIFQKGVIIVSRCQKFLDEAEQKIEMLTEDGIKTLSKENEGK